MSGGVFKKFTAEESISQLASTRASEQRRVRLELAEQYPHMEAYWEDVMPKKKDIMLVKCHEAVNLVTAALPDATVLFYQHHDGPFLPHLALVHRYPFILPSHRLDVGGCKFALSGATIMCPGLTSKGGRVTDGIDEGDAVALFIEGKRHAVAVGIALMSADDIRDVNKGPCFENEHYIGDGLWRSPVLRPA
jgi:PUA domain protein